MCLFSDVDAFPPKIASDGHRPSIHSHIDSIKHRELHDYPLFSDSLSCYATSTDDFLITLVGTARMTRVVKAPGGQALWVHMDAIRCLSYITLGINGYGWSANDKEWSSVRADMIKYGSVRALCDAIFLSNSSLLHCELSTALRNLICQGDGVEEKKRRDEVALILQKTGNWLEKSVNGLVVLATKVLCDDDLSDVVSTARKHSHPQWNNTDMAISTLWQSLSLADYVLTNSPSFASAMGQAKARESIELLFNIFGKEGSEERTAFTSSALGVLAASVFAKIQEQSQQPKETSVPREQSSVSESSNQGFFSRFFKGIFSTPWIAFDWIRRWFQ
eukprot:TRINITY_DN9595_c0_g1_i2.p1 TRINITY_DN9595_c0_g1~~TRINITY_DN9595_c0_g1_i2.p1  ORF type:complete len:333 (-),score=72.02 TRINITY_DN9595_c0_g1_i2:56-1054(-)